MDDSLNAAPAMRRRNLFRGVAASIDQAQQTNIEPLSNARYVSRKRDLATIHSAYDVPLRTLVHHKVQLIHYKKLTK